jgi:hypothetical protein
MKLLFISAAVWAAFFAIWIFFVVPTERRHHERKLAMIRKRIKERETIRAAQEEPGDNESGQS